MSTSGKPPGSDAPAGVAKPQGRYWLPEIVHLHLTALETGWLMGVLGSKEAPHTPINRPDKAGRPVATDMARRLQKKLHEAWLEHD